MQGRTNAKQSQISSAETKLSLLALTQGRAEMVQKWSFCVKNATFGLVYPAVTSVLQPVKKEGKKTVILVFSLWKCISVINHKFKQLNTCSMQRKHLLTSLFTVFTLELKHMSFLYKFCIKLLLWFESCDLNWRVIKTQLCLLNSDLSNGCLTSTDMQTDTMTRKHPAAFFTSRHQCPHWVSRYLGVGVRCVEGERNLQPETVKTRGAAESKVMNEGGDLWGVYCTTQRICWAVSFHCFCRLPRLLCPWDLAPLQIPGCPLWSSSVISEY